jgi:anti-sigma regulatory factor (Ser/Thr protein kinase)
MRVHDHIPTVSTDFQVTDERFKTLATMWAEWLDADDRHRIRLGLHELLVNIRHHAYRNSGGPIDVLFSATSETFHVDVTDWGVDFEGPLARPLPGVSAEGGYGLPIVAAAFDNVVHTRIAGRNWWTLEVRRPGGVRP